MNSLLNLNDFDLIENFENIVIETIDLDEDKDEFNIDLNIEIDVPEYLSELELQQKGTGEEKMDLLSSQILT